MIRDNFGDIPLTVRLSESKHIQVQVLTPAPNRVPVLVDKALETILPILWAQNIETLYSCQGDETMLGYIYFTSEEDQHAFHLLMAGCPVFYYSDPDGPAAISRFEHTALPQIAEYLLSHPHSDS